jgi:ribosomal protein S18 acetylase RimI-like enzyme
MLKTRKVQPDDLQVIAMHRRKMFEDMGAAPATLDAMTRSFTLWLKPRLEDGRYFGHLVEDGAAIIAGIGIMLVDWPPHSLHPESSQRGYLLNLYVEPEYRGRGIATDLTKLAESDLQARGVIYAILHASAKGRPIYRKLGWTPTSEMAKTLTIA